MKRDFTVDGDYKFIDNSPLVSTFRVLILGLIMLIFTPVFRLLYRYRVYGKENLPKRDTGFVLVSNHVHNLDCIMIGCLLKLRPTYYISQKSNLQIPVVGWLIKQLRTMPLPDTASGYRALMKAMRQIISRKGVIVIYPEGSIECHSNRIREFKRGAFTVAVKSSSPLIPVVITCRKRKHLPDRITMYVLPQIFVNGTGRNAEMEMEKKALKKMNDCMKTKINFENSRTSLGNL